MRCPAAVIETYAPHFLMFISCLVACPMYASLNVAETGCTGQQQLHKRININLQLVKCFTLVAINKDTVEMVTVGRR